jgi:hypothetical protein
MPRKRHKPEEAVRCARILARPHVPVVDWGGSSLIMSLDEDCTGSGGAEPQSPSENEVSCFMHLQAPERGAEWW